MLSKFEVSGFRGFKDKFTFDLNQAKDYAFNTEAVSNDVVKKGIIFGTNGAGKSNLGLAIFDIIFHIAQGFGSNSAYNSNYLNLESNIDYAEFTYHFNFDGNTVLYKYKKKAINSILSEEIFINGRLVASIDKSQNSTMFLDLDGADSLVKNLSETKIISIVPYIYRNTILNENQENSTFNKFVEFVEKMLLFKSIEGFRYLGLEPEAKGITLDIIENDNVEDFNKFLNDSGVVCKLSTIDKEDGTKTIAFDFGEKKLQFWTGASTGTKALALFYYWMQRLQREDTVSLVFIDEFDSFYHHELSVAIVERLKKIKSQVLLTTHNVSVMSNDILRPDCYFIMNKTEISPLYSKTSKELREAHNLGKMYKAGTFNG
ncbi:AAA family ATPase [Acinetobacter haemolyticus]|uniref:AAA family ATPase n=2 Tax=Acinetobacter haemolyticus TaxID=29430 RepID=UPI000F66BCF4|nr:ATP-binding protein [Acinetobacter haemolyticus]NAR61680.1 AAA family ATPase [Acinetobacter haemolyticus]NAR93753.1 AAA family ATPase [Acinetobacter haemolyticus]QHI18169.1 ATP-binding protein [Acinetobacter haemolyticus]RSC81602.1 ATP-binding protein [Acinetobacter haemolyticus]